MEETTGMRGKEALTVEERAGVGMEEILEAEGIGEVHLEGTLAVLPAVLRNMSDTVGILDMEDMPDMLDMPDMEDMRGMS
jgi:hypothetical protein